MFCKNCGKELADNTAYCPNCGYLQEGVNVVKEEKPLGNGMAIAGFVCSFFIPILGWIFGGIGLSRAAKRKGKGKGFSIAALAIASLMFVVGLSSF